MCGNCKLKRLVFYPKQLFEIPTQTQTILSTQSTGLKSTLNTCSLDPGSCSVVTRACNMDTCFQSDTHTHTHTHTRACTYTLTCACTDALTNIHALAQIPSLAHIHPNIDANTNLPPQHDTTVNSGSHASHVLPILC